VEVVDTDLSGDPGMISSVLLEPQQRRRRLSLPNEESSLFTLGRGLILVLIAVGILVLSL